VFSEGFIITGKFWSNPMLKDLDRPESKQINKMLMTLKDIIKKLCKSAIYTINFIPKKSRPALVK